MVRSTVAKHMNKLNKAQRDKLINDPSWLVRWCVAREGWGFEILVDDPDEKVRAVVAEHGYGVEKLKDDPHEIVRRCATRHAND
jgi:hypothetical protein